MQMPLRVLMVEDSPDDAQLIVRTLSKSGFEVSHQVVQRGPDFMSALQGQEWDLVLSDFSMPEYSGSDAFLALKECGIDVPFIFVSGHIGEERAAELMKLGASDYVLKDNLKRLVPCVHRELRESAARRVHQALADQLVRAEAGFKRLIDESLYGMIVYRQRGLVYANGAFARLYGYENPTQVLTQADTLGWAAPRHRDLLTEQVNRLLKGQPITQSLEVQGRRQDGRLIWVNVAAQVVDWNGQPAILSTQHEITERKLAEEVASSALARLRDAMECMPGGFFLLDADERLVLWNSQLGKDFPEIAPLLAAGRAYADILRAVAEQVDTDGMDPEAWQRQRLGQFRQAASSSVQQPFKDGRWFQALDHRTTDGGRVCMRLDITDHKRQEQELRQAQKVEALGQLTGGIAHDFNNLLQVISGYTQLCMEQAGPTAPLQRPLHSILDAATKASQLTQQLRTFSRKQVLNPTALNVNQVLRELASLLAPLLGEHLQLRLDAEPELASVVADRGMLEQVAMNLVINARDAMPNGGQITLRTRNAMLDEAACRGQAGAKPGQYVLLACVDTGTGMSPEVLEHIFEPFFTTKQAGRGTGLGLATVYGIVRQHKGVLQVSSTVGAGTRFLVYFPCQEMPPQASAQGAIGDAPGGHQTILIAEDSATVRDLLAQVLSDRGYQVICAEDGEAAVEQFRQHADQVDLVILDVVMPRMKGVEALDHIRRIKPGVRALFTSGWYGEVEERQLQQQGAALLYKPYTPATLLWTVHQMLMESTPNPAGGTP